MSTVPACLTLQSIDSSLTWWPWWQAFILSWLTFLENDMNVCIKTLKFVYQSSNNFCCIIFLPRGHIILQYVLYHTCHEYGTVWYCTLRYHTSTNSTKHDSCTIVRHKKDRAPTRVWYILRDVRARSLYNSAARESLRQLLPFLENRHFLENKQFFKNSLFFRKYHKNRIIRPWKCQKIHIPLRTKLV